MTRVTAALGLSLLLPFAAQAADWPQWRGPNRDGVWNEAGILKTFPAGGLKIRWRVPVGPGWSSPVVVQGRVYVTDMRLDKPRAWERMQCFKETTGKLLWSYARDGKLVVVVNNTGYAADIIHNSGTEPTASLRITTPTGTNVTLNNAGSTPN